eukprot:gene34681-biopygen35501
MGRNRQVDTFWTDCLKEQWKGRIVWCNPPFSDPDVTIDAILRHYDAEARQAPDSTAAMFPLPDFPQASWRPLLREYGMDIVEALRAEYRRCEYLRALKEELPGTQHHRTEHFRLVSDLIWRIAEGRYQTSYWRRTPLYEK